MENNSGVSYSLEADGDRGERRIRTVRALQFESTRLATFYYFKYKHDVNINQLAKRGFFYNRRSDTVCCFFCPTELQNSNKYEEPSTHAREDDKCKMTLFPLNGNVPLVGKFVREDFHSKLNAELEDQNVYKVDKAYPYQHTEIDFYSGFTGKEDFSIYEERLATFENWFYYLPPAERPFEYFYASIGFVYTGFSDIVVCYSCKGGFFNIDRRDDPRKDHMRYYSHCSFLRSSLSGKNLGYFYQHRYIHMPSVIFDGMPVMIHPLIQNLIYMKGYNQKFVKNWIIVYITIYGCYPIDIESCITKIEKAIEEEKKEIEEMKKSLEEREKILEEREKSLVEREKSLVEREKSLVEREKDLEEKKKSMEEKKKSMERESKIEEKNRTEEKRNSTEGKRKRSKGKRKNIEEKQNSMEKRAKSMKEKKIMGEKN